MSFDKLPFNWFDILIVIMLVVGIRRGRKHGLSEELTGFLTWLGVAVGCAFVYEPLGTLIAQMTVFSQLSGYLMAYIGAALVIMVVFSMLKKAGGGKLVGSDVFGGSEFYLGMAAGMVRFACILIAGIALLNARYYSSAEIQANLKFQNEAYGSNFFPTLQEVQDQVFKESLTGPFIKNQLGFLLIKSTAPEQKDFRRRELASP